MGMVPAIRPVIVRDVCKDEAMTLTLTLMRFVAAGYMTGEVACWDAAHELAETSLGIAEGPGLVAAVTVVMRAIRAERQADWPFMPAASNRVTDAEIALVSLIACARDGDATGTIAAATAITGGAACRLEAAAVRIAECLDACPRLRSSALDKARSEIRGVPPAPAGGH